MDDESRRALEAGVGTLGKLAWSQASLNGGIVLILEKAEMGRQSTMRRKWKGRSINRQVPRELRPHGISRSGRISSACARVCPCSGTHYPVPAAPCTYVVSSRC